MEGEKNTDAQDELQVEEKLLDEGTTPTAEALPPEEILERAKKENEAMGDERQRGRMSWGHYVGLIAAELAAVIVLIVTTIVQDRLPTEIYIILFTGIAAQDIAQACVCPKKQKIVFAVTGALIAACTLMYWVFWILELCGINI